MADDREERIRQRAYDLWQREGAPEGRDQDHWHEAVAQIDAEMAEGNEVAPGTAAAAGLAGRGDDLPLNADGLDEMDVEQARGAVGDGPGEEIADTTPATGTRRKAAAKKTEPGAAPKRGRPKKAANIDDPAKAGAKPGGNTKAAGEKKVSRRAVRSGPEKTAADYAKGALRDD
ncbi:DUF2934 domain-containing protein [Limimaricola variabilis]|uniref:DUF2934 domain-containing protein n=1 Tax=Limimaricola variabilis TaxID=1492771 RepID=UPI002AC8E3FD|nr:DUF2934 domain-containing protein [Limimaricola variabilis]WPY93952.1 DUF2934 domain-containing protein [Limimaricola variabilis]